MSDLSILIIEDDKDMANTLRLLFESKFDCETDTAGNCTETREKLQSNVYDIITLAYQLPDGNGLELLDEMVADENHPPIIMVTGHGDEKVTSEAFQKGAFSYVVKDSRMTAILPASILKALEGAGYKSKRIQEDFNMLYEKYRGIFDNSKSGIAVYEVVGDGDDFVFKDLNKAAEGIDKISKEEVVGKSVLEVFPSTNLFGLLDKLQRVWRTGAPEQLPLFKYSDEKTIRWRDNYVYKLSTGELVAIYEDVTELKRVKEALLERAARLGAITEGAMDAIFLVDSKAIIRHWNPAAETLYGYTEEEAIGQSVGIINTEQSRQAYVTSTKSFTLSGQRTFSGEVPSEMLHVGKNRTEFPVEISVSRLQIGDEWYAEVIARDITERKAAEEALRQTSDYLENLLNYANAPVVVWDPSFRITRFNHAFERLVGRSADEVVGGPLDTLFPGDSCDDSMEHIRRTMTGEHWESLEIPILRADGSVRTVLWNSATLFEEDGETVVATIAQGQDITDRKQDEEALQRANIELEGYAHTVSHDLKGPLSTASLAFDMLMSVMEEVETPEEKAEQFMEAIEAGRSSMVNAHNIIENLLALAEAGEPQDVSPVNIEDTINKVLEENAEMIKEKGIAVKVASPLGAVVSSPTHIFQLFTNLIRNSVEYNNDKNPAIEISSLGVDGTIHRFLVRDNGQGIPEEILDDVFMPFVKAQSSGSGVGLSIVEKIVKTYGGEIRAYNDNGACFEFTLKDYDEAGL